MKSFSRTLGACPRLITLTALLAAMSLVACARAQQSGRESTALAGAGEWRSLFDGKSLAGWEATGNREGWAVEDGAIACLARGGGYLYTREQFQDFILRLEFKVARRVNSGIFLRWTDLNDPVDTGIEVQVLDSFGRMRPGRHDCGAIYDIQAPSIDAARPAGVWNEVEITAAGPIVRVVLNQQQVVQIDLRQWTTPRQNPDGSPNKFRLAYNTMTKPGHIGLQDHGGRVWFRNLRIMPLEPRAPRGAIR